MSCKQQQNNKVRRCIFWVVVSTSETSVNLNQTTWRNNPEDSHLHNRRRENLKSYYQNGTNEGLP
jgi:hypothetical protein